MLWDKEGKKKQAKVWLWGFVVTGLDLHLLIFFLFIYKLGLCLLVLFCYWVACGVLFGAHTWISCLFSAISVLISCLSIYLYIYLLLFCSSFYSSLM